MTIAGKDLPFLNVIVFTLLVIAAVVIWMLFFRSLTLEYDENVNTLAFAFLLSLIYILIVAGLSKWRKSMLNKFGTAMFVAGIITNPVTLLLATIIAINM